MAHGVLMFKEATISSTVCICVSRAQNHLRTLDSDVDKAYITRLLAQ